LIESLAGPEIEQLTGFAEPNPQLPVGDAHIMTVSWQMRLASVLDAGGGKVP